LDRSKIEYISAVRLLIKVNARFSPSEFDFNTSLKVYVFPVPAPANIVFLFDFDERIASMHLFLSSF
jgi:hypothetical protein